jgi:hypothetical protein
MAVEQVLLERVRSDAIAIAAEEVKEPAGSVPLIIEDFQNFTAQLLEDRPAFVAANRGVENIDYAQAVLYELLNARSEAIIGRQDISDILKLWEKEKPGLLTIESKLMAAAWDLTYVYPELTAVVREIEEGSSNLDSINDVFSCTKIGRRYLQHFAAITIEGDTLDAAYLDRAEAKAGEMLELLNKIEHSRTAKSADIDFRNRVILLSKRVKNQAWRDMRIVFWNQPDRRSAYFRHTAATAKPAETPVETVA